VIIFFDEFDSLVGLDMSSTLRGTILGRLSDKRGVRSNDSKLILIGATNFYEKIDEAVKRKGRFDVHLLLDNPKEEIALKLIKEFLGKEKIYLATENSESSIIKEIYNDIKKYEFQKQYDLLLKTLKNSNIGNKEEIQERIDEAEKKFRVSSSTLKSEVI
ncbi:AAA family ATPase, partial [Fusobacterium mortiferum]